MNHYNYNDIKDIAIRIGNWDWYKDAIDICPHMKIRQADINYPYGHDGEYNNYVPIYCNICKKEYTITIAIN